MDSVNVKHKKSLSPEICRIETTKTKSIINEEENNDLVSFEMTVLVDEAVKPTPEQLLELGADGLVRRYALLKKLGLPL